MNKIEEINSEQMEIKEIKAPRLLYKDVLASFMPLYGSGSEDNWAWKDIDKYGIDADIEYKKLVEMSRFFYKSDPLASTIINKIIDIAITDVDFYKGDLSENELRIFVGMKEKLREFLENCALEMLLTGMVIPEVTYGAIDKSTLKSWGVKKMQTFVVPTEMWIRDSGTITVNKSPINSELSYYVNVPDDVVFFITSGGKYPDGTEDKALYQKLLVAYPDFVKKVDAGEVKIKLVDPLVVEHKRLVNSAYPLPYTSSALESMRHKRNLRKMDYSIAARVITAIQLVRLGDKDFPLTEDDKDQLNDIKEQMYYRQNPSVDTERVFQLFGNHTLQIDWIFPDVDALLDDKKYANVNSDIMFAFGFPRILITGETERTQTSSAEFALLSPVKTMENLRSKLMVIVNDIINNIVDKNRMPGKPVVKFSAMNLHDFSKYFEQLLELYKTGNISRETIDNIFGLDIHTELQKRKEETALLEELGLEEFSPVPNSNAPGIPGKQIPGKPASNKPQSKPNEK